MSTKQSTRNSRTKVTWKHRASSNAPLGLPTSFASLFFAKMSLYRLITTLVLSISYRVLVVASADPAAKLPVTTTAMEPVGNSNSPVGNSTDSGGRRRSGMDTFPVDSSMIQRALYVLIGITLTGLLYFLIRAVRLKKPASIKKKYGLLSNYDDSVEMEGVQSEEDETLYEARNLRR